AHGKILGCGFPEGTRKRFSAGVDSPYFQSEQVLAWRIRRDPELTPRAIQENLIGRSLQKNTAEVGESIARRPRKISRNAIWKVEVEVDRRGWPDVYVTTDPNGDRGHTRNGARPDGLGPQLFPGWRADSDVWRLGEAFLNERDAISIVAEG